MSISITQTIGEKYFPYIDMACIFLAYAISFMLLPYLRPFLSPYPEGGAISIRNFAWILVILTPIWFILMFLEGAYQKLVSWSYLVIFGRMGKIAILTFACSALVIFIMKEVGMSRLFMSSTCMVLLMLTTSSRFIYRLLVNRKRARGELKEEIILIGDGDSVSRFIRDVLPEQKRDLVEIIGYVDTENGKNEIHLPRIGFSEDLKDVLNGRPVAQAILILTKQNRDLFQKIFDICEETGTSFRVINEYLFNRRVKSRYVWRNDFFADIPSLYATEVNWSAEKEITKRIFDLLFSGIAILFLSPLIGLIAIAVKLSSPGPAFYRRQLVGRHGKPFVALKFRSMVENAHEQLQIDRKLRAEYQESLKIKNDPRVTKFGNFLRKTSLDELPQFFNVFKGEMSVVGPRMLGDIEWEKYGEAKAKVLSVKPGITGPWQVNGRHEATFEERIKYDMDYINNHNLTNDLAIVLKTILIVFKMRGAH